MPIRIPKGKTVTIQKRELPADYSMPQMEMAADHYSLGFLISGDRHVITPLQQFDYHPGDVAMMPPLLYHRTISHSEDPYISYLIKISGELKEEFCEHIDRKIWDTLFDQKVCSFTKEQQAWITAYLEDMLAVYEAGMPYSDTILQGMLNRLMVYIYENRSGGGAFNFGSELSREILEALYRIEKSYAEELTLEEMAAEAGFSTAYFSRLFKAQLGVAFSEYLTNVRVRHVQELLAQTDKSISEIALETGFCNGDYLAARFKQRVGMTPTAFRKNLFHLGCFFYFFWCFFSLFTGYAHAYIDPSAVTYMIQAVAAVAIAAGAALTVFRHRIAALFRRKGSVVKRREIRLKNGWEGIFDAKQPKGKKGTAGPGRQYSVEEDLYQ